MRHMEDKKILTDTQHGFRKHRSCESQLIITIQEIAKTIDDRKQTDVILLDFSKAFDKVPHKRLLKKLHHYGIRGSVLTWIKSFLSDRKQSVVLEGSKSHSAAVESGVPQGSVLGPTLFLAYINDLPSYIKNGSTARLFADDCVLYHTIESKEDAAKLQGDLDALQRWEDDWLMEFHPQKCQTLHITNKRNVIKHKYQIHGHELEEVESAKYLGVTIHNKLSWNNHINNITNKANGTRAFLQRNLHQCPRKTKELCYKTLVRPQLEYASTVWDPPTSTQCQKIEMVQRRAARFVIGDYHRTSSVDAMIEKLKWQTLQQRRDINKAVLLYRIYRNLVAIPSDMLIKKTQTSRTHEHAFLLPYCRTLTYQSSYFPSAIRIWNGLSANVVAAKTLEQFQNLILKG